MNVHEKRRVEKNQKQAPAGKRDKTALFILLMRIPLGVGLLYLSMTQF